MPENTTALLFPGQGSQEAGMGRDLAESSKDAMELWKSAERISNVPLREIYWEGDTEAMANTRNLQPALTVVNMALYQFLAPHLSPACVAGHSLGEYSALVAAKVISPEDALNIVSIRGQLMAEADPEGKGAMAAILKMPLQTVRDLVDQVAKDTGETLIVANYNTPAQFVISGTKGAVAEAQSRVKELKGRAIPLAVSGAFHSPLMDKAAAELRRALNRVTWRRPQTPIFCNVTGTAIVDGESLGDIMPRQMTSSVMWIDTITNQYHSGVRQWIEIGPKGVLGKMVKPILSASNVADDYSTLSIGNMEQVEAFLG